MGPVPGNVPNCPLLIVKSSGASNWAASTEVSNRGYKCVLASPNASRCLPTSKPNCLRSRLLDLANWSASSSVSTPPPLPCALAQGNRHSVATSTQGILNSTTSINAPIDRLSLIAADRSAKCDELLTLSSLSRDPLADVCWAILELDVAGFAAP